MSDSTSLRESLLAQVIGIASDYKTRENVAKAQADNAKAVKDSAQKEVTDLSRAAAGFAAPRIAGIGAVAALFGASFNDPTTQEAEDTAKALATTYVATYTGKSEKTMKGGGAIGQYAAMVRLGQNGPRLIGLMQARLDHWQRQFDSGSEGESATDAAARKAQAERFVRLADSDKTDKSGAPIPDSRRYAGRPERTVNGILIAAGKGQTREGLLAYAARLVLAHGDDALHPDVLDAILDNGGKVEKPETAAGAAGKAAAAIEDLLSKFGGSASGDGAFLTMAGEVLSRIAAQGFKTSGAATAAQVAAANPPPPPPPAAPVQFVPVEAPPPPPPPPAEGEASEGDDTVSLLSTLPEAEDDPAEGEGDTDSGIGGTDAPPPPPPPAAKPVPAKGKGKGKRVGLR